MKRTEIDKVLKEEAIGAQVKVNGWVRTFRNDRFIALNDGSTIKNLQVVVSPDSLSEDLLKAITTGSAIEAIGEVVASQGSGQKVELQARSVEVLGKAHPDEFPLQPKRHSLEFLREKAHLRMRTSTFSAVFRIRHAASYAIHKFFHDEGFFMMHSPIITGSDAEGAGEMFRVTHLDLNDLPMGEDGKVDDSQDFFGKVTNLTVSGQLEAELGALALGKVYTFGPTFRAENSNTSRHLAEFWMIEPEVAFADLNDDMDLAEKMLRTVIGFVKDHCADDLAFLDEREKEEDKNKPLAERHEIGLLERLDSVVSTSYERITYTEAIDILRNSNPFKKKKFKYPVEWGTDLQSEHERYLVEKHFKKPVILTDYPAKIKAFYMRLNDDGKTVAAMDILFPGIGELVGGSQREERYEVLMERCKAFDIPEEHVWWYLETRKFGTCKHAGFGLGFERLVMFITGMSNVRDVIPFPRTPLNASF